MEQFAMAYWWLIFPIMWFVFGIFGMWMAHRRHSDTLELMKTYAAQGKDPAEIAKVMSGPGPNAWGDPWAGPWGGGPWGSRWAYRSWRRGPYWEWRRAIVLCCVALGLWVGSQFSYWPGTENGLLIAAIIVGIVAAGSVVFAIMSTVMGPRLPPNE